MGEQEAIAKDTRCVAPSCGMKIRSKDDGILFGLSKDGPRLPFHKKCLLPLLNDVAEKSGVPLESLVNEVPKAVIE